MSPSNTAIINGTAIAAPEGAIAYKYSDPTEDARWIYDEDDLREIAREDPALIARVNARIDVLYVDGCRGIL